ncbi:hypothetical protein LZ554_007076 [Drepanopeziza brunnea f. sp. 'monogermtubi']|nr:hypothetical protein LZ554_007076 [Drepanopeziza brunnea f. sp. 'monogermtubi']
MQLNKVFLAENPVPPAIVSCGDEDASYLYVSKDHRAAIKGQQVPCRYVVLQSSRYNGLTGLLWGVCFCITHSTRTCWLAREEDGKTEMLQLFGDEDRIVEYMGTLMSEPEKALRFSDLGVQGKVQMLIPTKVVNSGALDLWAICFETARELIDYSDVVVDWKVWDFKGDPEHMIWSSFWSS